MEAIYRPWRQEPDNGIQEFETAIAEYGAIMPLSLYTMVQFWCYFFYGCLPVTSLPEKYIAYGQSIRRTEP